MTFAKGQVGFISFVLIPFFNLFPPYLPELQNAVDTLTANKEKWVKIASGEMPLPPALLADDTKLGWSVNVGYIAVGHTSDIIRKAQPVEKLMSKNNAKYGSSKASTE